MPKPILTHSKEYERFADPILELSDYIRNFNNPAEIKDDADYDRSQIDIDDIYGEEEKEEEEPILTQKDFYAKLENLFREDIDAQHGIVRSLEYDAKYPTAVAAVRDATAAKDITDPTIDHYRVEANNLLLRVLGRLRGIDYVLGKKSSEATSFADQQLYDELRAQLQNDFAQLTTYVFETADKAKKLGLPHNKEEKTAFQNALDSLEKQFNTETLCNVLHSAHLDAGCGKPKDYETLLFHYRNLAALIDPAKSLVTISLDSTNNVLHRITQDPITTKSAEQKQNIFADMTKTTLFPSGLDKTFQTKQLMAMQVANHYFAELASKDNRMLGAQTRKSHLHGIKNAFFVTNELLFNVDGEALDRNTLLSQAALPENTQHFARSATPVYIGGGETDARLQASTHENIEQVRQFIIQKFALSPEEADATKIHFTCLVTDSPMEHQNLMIRHTYDDTRRNPDSANDVTYVPCNWDGTHRRIDLSSMVTDNPPSIHPTPSNQAERYRRAAQVSVEIRGKQQIFELVACASGQDRTETESEYATQEWARQQYLAHGIQMDVTDEIKKQQGDIVEQTRARSRNSAEINAHMLGGSRGCKNDSRGKTALIDYDNLYSRETDTAMYLKSANTNKRNPVDQHALKMVMEKSSPFAEREYTESLEALQNACQRPRIHPRLQAMGEVVLAEVAALKDRVKHKDLSTLISVIKQSTIVVNGPVPGHGPDPLLMDKRNKENYADEVARLGALIKGINKKPLWKKLANAMLLLGGIALITAGILFAIPSGGSSLLACLLGAKAIAVAGLALGVKAAIGVGAVTALSGAAATYESQSKSGFKKESGGLFSAAHQLEKAGKSVLKEDQDADQSEKPLLGPKPQH
ncbi:MAG: hypothetical protein P4M14_01725 [Gammaproteobacteria bacterium]|nr:hypothetical protein [Gammaproteobacteria bacterium]